MVRSGFGAGRPAARTADLAGEWDRTVRAVFPEEKAGRKPALEIGLRARLEFQARPRTRGGGASRGLCPAGFAGRPAVCSPPRRIVMTTTVVTLSLALVLGQAAQSAVCPK